MSFQALAWARNLSVGNPTAKYVLLMIANYADEHGVAWPSQERLAIDTELGVRSIRRSVAYLTAAGLISVEARSRRHDGQRDTNILRLAMPPEANMSYGQRQRPLSPKPEATVASKPIKEPPPYSSQWEGKGFTVRGSTPAARADLDDERF